MSCDDRSNPLPLRRFDQIGPREHDHIGPPQSGERLAQRAAGKDVPEAKRLQRIDDDDIQIAMDAPMLKRVVEQNQLAIEFLDRHLRRRDAVGILNVRHVGQLLLQFKSFVVPRAGFGAVAAADDRHAHAALRGTNGPAIRPTAFCPCRQASDCRR